MSLPTVPSPWNMRFSIVAFVAVAASLPMAWISLSKLVLFFAALVYLAGALIQRSPNDAARLPGFVWLILGAIGLFAASLVWTSASLEYGLQALVKHAKLVSVVLIIYLLRSTREAEQALALFIGAQVFVLASCWLLAAELNLPWVAPNSWKHVVFAESYLDQSIMFCCTVAMALHLRIGILRAPLIRAGVAGAGLAAVVFLLPGRTGILIAACLVALAVFWKLSSAQRRWSAAALACVLALGALLAPVAWQDQLRTASQQGMGQRSEAGVQQSNAWRMHAWQLSVQAIGAAPVAGTGAGSWSPTIKQLHGADADQVFGMSEASNPHQEFLLWGVSLGLPGLLLLISLFAFMAREAMQFEETDRRAALSLLLTTGVACSLNSALFDDLLGDYLCVALGLVMAYGRLKSVVPTPKLAP